HRVPGAADAGEVPELEVVTRPRLVAAGGGDDGHMVPLVVDLVAEAADRRVHATEMGSIACGRGAAAQPRSSDRQLPQAPGEQTCAIGGAGVGADVGAHGAPPSASVAVPVARFGPASGADGWSWSRRRTSA